MTKIKDLDEILGKSNLNYDFQLMQYESILRQNPYEASYFFSQNTKQTPIERDTETDRGLQAILGKIK